MANYQGLKGGKNAAEKINAYKQQKTAASTEKSRQLTLDI
jgi:hypothetical protein